MKISTETNISDKPNIVYYLIFFFPNEYCYGCTRRITLCNIVMLVKTIRHH
jgi:peroxiredoxin